MEIVGNTLMNVNLTAQEEAKIIFGLTDQKEKEIILFLMYKDDLIDLESNTGKVFKTVDFKGASEFERKPHSKWTWVVIHSFEDLEVLLNLDWFLYECRIISNIKMIKKPKYAITMMESYKYKDRYCKAISFKGLDGNNITEDELRTLVCNSGRGDI